MADKIDVSVLCPTRGRPDMLRGSIQSLIATAASPGSYEVLLAVDPDDMKQPVLDLDAPFIRLWTAPERYGYMRLHEYYNALAAQARGTWLLLWNDDASMRTLGWDRVIAGQPEGILWLQANHHTTGNLFPAWPKRWTDACGYVSQSANVDRWLSEVGRALRRERKIPVEVFHDRADITGANYDQTFREGREVMGNADAPDFGSIANEVARDQCVLTIRRLL